MAKNPLLNPPKGSRHGQDFVKSPDGGYSAKGTDFVASDGHSKQGFSSKGKDFVAVSRETKHGSINDRGGPAASACPESIPEGGSNTVEALHSKLVPGFPAQGGTEEALRPEQGGVPSQNKPYRLK